MDFSSSEELPYQEPTSSPIHQEPIYFVPLTSTEQMLAEPEPSSSHSPSSSSPNKPETQTNPESYKVMPESVVEDIIQPTKSLILHLLQPYPQPLHPHSSSLLNLPYLLIP